MDLEKLVLIDETWASTYMTREHGRAPMVADEPMEGELVLAWVWQFLCPTLQPADIVILDHLSSHKVAGCNWPSPPSAQPCSICRPIRPT